MLKTQVILKEKFTQIGDLAYASRTVNGDFLFTQNESGWQNQRSFKGYIQRIDEELKDVARPVFVFLDNYPSHINIQFIKQIKMEKAKTKSKPSESVAKKKPGS